MLHHMGVQMLVLPEDPFPLCVEVPVTREKLDTMARFCSDHAIEYRCRQAWPLMASRARWCFMTEAAALAFQSKFGGEIGFAWHRTRRLSQQPR